jgi:hypothetical protein
MTAPTGARRAGSRLSETCIDVRGYLQMMVEGPTHRGNEYAPLLERQVDIGLVEQMRDGVVAADHDGQRLANPRARQSSEPPADTPRHEPLAEHFARAACPSRAAAERSLSRTAFVS